MIFVRRSKAVLPSLALIISFTLFHSTLLVIAKYCVTLGDNQKKDGQIPTQRVTSY